MKEPCFPLFPVMEEGEDDMYSTDERSSSQDSQAFLGAVRSPESMASALAVAASRDAAAATNGTTTVKEEPREKGTTCGGGTVVKEEDEEEGAGGDDTNSHTTATYQELY